MTLFDKLFPKEVVKKGVSLGQGDGNLIPPRPPAHSQEDVPIAKVEAPPVSNSDIVPIYFYDKNDFQSVDTAVAILSEAIRALRHQSYTKLRVRLEIDALQRHPDD